MASLGVGSESSDTQVYIRQISMCRVSGGFGPGGDERSATEHHTFLSRTIPWSNLDMDVRWMIDRLDRFPPALRALLLGCSDEDARWRPSDADWSIVEVVCHLVDEDLDDFGTRLRLVLESPETDWPRIDPEAAAVDRGYRSRGLDEVVRELGAVRRAKLEWLRTSLDADFTQAATHPRLQDPPHRLVRAGDLLASWCAHDALHLRQIAKRLHQLTDHRAGDFDVGYAGTW